MQDKAADLSIVSLSGLQAKADEIETRAGDTLGGLYRFEQENIARPRDAGKDIDWHKLPEMATPLFDSVDGEDGIAATADLWARAFSTRLEHERKRIEKQYEVATMTSRVVYVLGFAIAIIAQVAGIPKMSE